MIVSVTRPQRPYADLSDLTAKEIIGRGWQDDSGGQEQYVVQFAVNLTAAEEAAVRRRLATSGDVEETLFTQGAAALDTNRNYRDTISGQIAAGADAIIANPAVTQANMRSLAQGIKALNTQVDALTRQHIALIRVSQGLLDSAD